MQKACSASLFSHKAMDNAITFQETLSMNHTPPPISSALLPMWLFWVCVGMITFLRLLVIYLSPLELGVDEAQYWLWGQHLDFGYYSKPPLIGWLLGLGDMLFGSSAFATRIFAPFLHLGTALILFFSAKQLGGIASAQIASLLWLTLPSVGLASFVISTDSVMLLFWSLGLFCILKATGAPALNKKWMLAAGLAIGVAMLAKYAAVYFIIGLAGWMLTRRLTQNPHPSFTSDITRFAVFMAGAAIGAAPTWIWNLMNGFVTVRHLGQNANLEVPAYSISSMLEFIAAQAGVIGPVCFVLLIVIFFSRTKTAAETPSKPFFIWFILPPLLVISVQAFLKEANANWAVAAYPAGMLLLAIAGSLRMLWRRYLQIAILVNLTLCIAIAVILAAGSFGIFSPKSDPLRRLRGWAELAENIQNAAQEHHIKTIVAHNRATAALLHWHLADQSYQIVIQANENAPANHYERAYPLTDEAPRPLLVLADKGKMPQGGAHSPTRIGFSETRISARRTRYIEFWKLD